VSERPSFNFSEFLRTNLFPAVNLLVVIGGLAYYSGELQSSVAEQNLAIQQIQNQISALQASAVAGQQNTLDIGRLRAETDGVTGKLDVISNQISTLTQWVKDHGGNP